MRTRTSRVLRDGRRRAARAAPPHSRQDGFTLMELLIVIAIIGILVGIVLPKLTQTPQKAKEAVLKQNLFILRDVIDQYFADKGKYPDSLQTLVDEGYIRKLPVDPLTESDQTWVVEYSEATDEDPEGGGGVYDVHSGASGIALDGSRYSDW
ncbi:MAG: type II secretion system protein [Acidobacteriota bacterium]